MIIYLITNTINGKRYVGQTIKSLNKRWSQHKIDSRNYSELALHRAIRKYGPNVFSVETLEICNSTDILNEKEVYWIKYLKSKINGYNCTDGGNGVGSGESHPWFGKHHTKETKLRLSIAKSGSLNPSFGKLGSNSHNFGLKRSEETKAKIRLARSKQVSPMKGRKVSEETKDKIRATLLAKVTPEFRIQQSIYGKLGGRHVDS
jgi:group I intron endonuclease